MLVREATDNDAETIKELHGRAAFGYDLPDFSLPQFFSRRVVADQEGFGVAVYLRLTSEAYLFANAEWRTPAWRMEALRQLHLVCKEDCLKKGVTDTACWMPPQIEKRFGRRLLKLGWQKQLWPTYSTEVR